MKIVHLHHDPKLNYPKSHDLPLLEWDMELPEDSVVVSFRKNKTKPDIVKKNFHACERLLDLPVTKNLVLIGLETDSPLAPLILWDLLHIAPINTKIIMIGNLGKQSYLQRQYFKNSLRLLSENSEQQVFEKIAPLPIEKDKGLSRFSFCIPVGPEDATGLNAIVKRILELDVPEKEIILCGRPAQNFLYWDQVRIVGEEIPAPPVRICAKKNALVNAARFENICIIHDRVFLPKDFYQGIRRFGDLFPFVSLQSIYFSDQHHVVPFRYSDYHQVVQKSVSVQGINREGKCSKIFPNGLAEFEKNKFVFANPCRYTNDNYATGSLYICKKSLWLMLPQDENIFWGEFEDVEHGLRLSAQGVPTRVNPFIFTQSLYARPLLLSYTYQYENIDGDEKYASFPRIPWMKSYKPAFKISLKVAMKKLRDFVSLYVSVSHQVYMVNHLAKIPKTLKIWLTQVGLSLHLAKVNRDQDSVDKFLRDVERMIFLDQLPYGSHQYLRANFQEHGSNAKNNLFEHYGLWHNLLTGRGCRKKVFYENLQDFFVKRNKKTLVGSFLTACWLRTKNKNLFYHPDGLMGYYRAIINSTPFLEDVVRNESEKKS